MLVRFGSIALGALIASCVASPPQTTLTREQWIARQRAANANNYGHFLVGRYASLTSDPATAAQRYAAAAQFAPEDVVLGERAIFSALLAGDVEAATALAQAASDAEAAPSSLARLTLGAAALSQGSAREALALLDEEALGPFNAIVGRGLSAWAVYETRGLDAAANLLAHRMDSGRLMDGLSYYTLALIQSNAGEDAAALATLEAAWTGDVRLAVVAEAYGRLLAAEGRRDEALKLVREFRDTVGVNPAVDALRAELEAGRPVRPLRPTLAEGAARVVYAPAAVLAAQSGTDIAGAYFTLALALDPQLDAARALLGDTLDTAGRRDEAIEVLAAVPAGSPFYASAQGQIAWALRREGRDDEAITLAQTALAAQPDRDLKIQLGDLFRSLDQHARAERVFDEIIAEDTARGEADWRLLYARGAARERLGRWREAEADLLRALDVAPDRPEVMNYLGYTWVDRGENIRQAFDLIQRAADLRPESGAIIDSLGWAHYKLGRYHDAVRHLERAVELSPGDATLNDHLGDAYWRVGRRVEAEFQWTRALDLKPNAGRESEILIKLTEGLPNDRWAEPVAAPAPVIAANP